MVPEGVCIQCGTRAGPLFRQYSPAVLKLTQCKRCGKIADKYLEYDPVIVIVDLVLLSTAAFRHVLYNTEFKSYWRLFVILLIMETYVDWESRNSPRISSAEEPTPNIFSNDSFLHIFQGVYTSKGLANVVPKRSPSNNYDTNDPFVFQMRLYVSFVCSFFAMAIFFLVAYIFSIFFKLSSLLKESVDSMLFFKAFTLASGGNFLLLPALIWGNEHDRTLHLAFVLGYTFLAFTYIHSVVFQCRKINSLSIVLISYVIKVCIATELKNASLALI